MIYITTDSPSATKDNGPVPCLGDAGLGNNCRLVIVEPDSGETQLIGWECLKTWQETIDLLAHIYHKKIITQAAGE